MSQTGGKTMTAPTEPLPVLSTAPPVAIHKLLNGQKALVTGANSGIGKGAAVTLGQAGADVVVNYVEGEDAANAAVDEIRKAGANAYAHAADVIGDSIAAMFKHMINQFGTIDILVICALARLRRNSCAVASFHPYRVA
jgi:glucose 1-dehydrogenase